LNLDETYVKEVAPVIRKFEVEAKKINFDEITKSEVINDLSNTIKETFNRYYGGGNLQDALNKYYQVTGTPKTEYINRVAEVVEKRSVSGNERPPSKEQEATKFSSSVNLDNAYKNEVKDSIKEFEKNASQVNIVDTAKSRLLPLGEKIQNTYVKYYGDGSFKMLLTNITKLPIQHLYLMLKRLAK